MKNIKNKNKQVNKCWVSRYGYTVLKHKIIKDSKWTLVNSMLYHALLNTLSILSIILPQFLGFHLAERSSLCLLLFVIFAFVFVTHFYKCLPGSLGYKYILCNISAISRTLIEIWIVNDFTSLRDCTNRCSFMHL